MAELTGVPWQRTTVAKYVNGSQTQHVNSTPTSWYLTRAKQVTELPPFVPGQFNVKPYSISCISLTGRPSSEVSKTWSVPDMKTVTETWALSAALPGTQIPYVKRSHIQNNAAAVELALQEAFGKLNAAQWDAAVDLAELGETFDMLKDGLKALASPIKGIPKLASDFRRYLKKRPKRQLPSDKSHEYTFESIKKDADRGSDKAANIWLLWRYGIMPLLLSIQDALALLEAQLQKADKQIRTVRRRPAPVVVEGHLAEKRPRYISQMWTYEARIEAIVYYRRTADETLKEALGLIPENIPSVLWEATTLSFVWDWFFNIGSFLNALKPKIGVEVLGATTSIKETFINDINYILSFSGGEALSPSISAPGWQAKSESFKRTVRPGSSYTPEFTGLDGMTIARWADAAALALRPIKRALRPPTGKTSKKRS